jgi:phosphatidate cytidylyltransferase
MSLKTSLGAALSADLLPRTVSGVVMIGAALGALWAGGVVFTLFWTLCAAALIYEWQSLISAPARWTRIGIGIAAMCCAVIGLRLGSSELILGASLLGIAGAAALAGPGKRIWAGAGVLYALCLVLSVVVLRVSSAIDGLEAILWIFAVVWGTDIMAYFGGRLIGGPKLWPRVSPSKTWSGFITGVTSGALLGVAAVAAMLGAAHTNVLIIFLVGLIGGVVAQGGDLLESSIKRHFGAKDSSHLIPGHGGFMDRLDGFIVTATCAALLGLAKAAGPGFVATGLMRW